jgi:hypothetical protein
MYLESFQFQPMDIEPPIKPANDSDDNKSNDSTASQPQHLQEMAKSTVVLKEVQVLAPMIMPNDNANAEAPTPINVVPLQAAVQPEAPPTITTELKTPEVPAVIQPPPQTGLHSAPSAPAQIPPTASVPGPIPHSQEASIPPPNVNVAHHQGMGIAGPHLPPHGSYPGYPQGPPRAPFAPYAGHMPPYQQGFQQYPYGHHMPPYQQNYHAPPHGYPVPGHPPGAENQNPYQGPPSMHAPIPHQNLPPTMPPVSGAAPVVVPQQPEEPAVPSPAAAVPEKNGS